VPIVVLDEVDQLIMKDGGEKLLYDLLRAVETEKARIGLILISNDISLTAKLDARVKSSLSEEKIIFPSYTPAQLKDILKERSSFAFVPNALADDVIPLAAAHASKLGGDARVAIEALLKAGRQAEKENSEKVEVKHLKKAFEVADSASLIKGIKHLIPNEKILLELIASSPGIQSGAIFEEFSKKSPGLSERRLRDLLNELEKKNFIVSELVELGNKGKTRKFSSRLQREILLKALKETP
jgi:cell division control protein 6